MAEKKEKKYVSDNAQLMAEWDWEKNNELGIDPYKVTLGSDKRVFWKCKNGHSWQTSARPRVIEGTKCPYCSGEKPIAGINDLATTHPERPYSGGYVYAPKKVLSIQSCLDWCYHICIDRNWPTFRYYSL